MTRILVALVLWAPLAVAAACCPGPRVVTKPIIIRGPSCLPGPAPVVPEGVEYGTAAWAGVYVETQAWIVATEASCGPQPIGSPPIGSIQSLRSKPDPGPAWWTRQPSGAVGE